MSQKTLVTSFNMLRFIRGFSTTRCVLQEVARVEENKNSVEAFLKYWRTPRDLRILMYRPKHAQELLSRDLIDPQTDKRARPLQSPTLPSKYAIGSYIQQVSDQKQLPQLQEDLELIAKRSNAITSYHLNEMLIKFAQFRRLQNALVFLHTNPSIEPARDLSNFNMSLFFLYLNPNKAFKNKVSKIQRAERTLKQEPDAISELLKCAIFAKEGKPAPKALYEKVQQSKVSLPFDVIGKSVGHQLALLTEFQHTYLFLKAISQELGTHADYKMLSSVRYIQGFIFQYEELMKKLGKPNRYEEVLRNSRFYKVSIKPKEERLALRQAEKAAKKARKAEYNATRAASA